MVEEDYNMDMNLPTYNDVPVAKRKALDRVRTQRSLLKLSDGACPDEQMLEALDHFQLGIDEVCVIDQGQPDFLSSQTLRAIQKSLTGKELGSPAPRPL